VLTCMKLHARDLAEGDIQLLSNPGPPWRHRKKRTKRRGKNLQEFQEGGHNGEVGQWDLKNPTNSTRALYYRRGSQVGRAAIKPELEKIQPIEIACNQNHNRERFYTGKTLLWKRLLPNRGNTAVYPSTTGWGGLPSFIRVAGGTLTGRRSE